MNNDDLDAHAPAIAAGDAAAFARWLAGAEHELRASLSSFARHLDTEAVLQEALLRLWQVAPQFTPDQKPNGLLRLARRITRNLAIDELRRRRIEPEPKPEPEPEPVEPWAPDPKLRAMLATCHEKLSGKPKLALEARLLSAGADEDRELARRLNMQLNTFLQNITRARRSLLECLEKHGVTL